MTKCQIQSKHDSDKAALDATRAKRIAAGESYDDVGMSLSSAYDNVYFTRANWIGEAPRCADAACAVCFPKRKRVGARRAA